MLYNHTDHELLALMKPTSHHAEQAFKELYARYSARIRTYCFTIMDQSQDAEDIFQETFVKFYRLGQQEYAIENAPAYLLRIARNLCFDRKKQQQHLLPLDSILDSQANEHYVAPWRELRMNNSDSTIEHDELFALLESALKLLDDEYREAFILREYEHLEYERIGELTGTNAVNARSRVFRAKQQLKAILKPYIQDIERYS